MVNMPLISIIIPCFNAEKYLCDTLKSLEMQSSKEFEVICIDDGSSDSTWGILSEWEKSRKIDVKAFRQPNKGVSAARNNGIMQSNGSYIMFLDADDSFHPEMIDIMIRSLEKNKTDTVYCYVTRDEKEFVLEANKALLIEQKSKEEAMSDLLFNMKKISFCSYLYNRKILLDNNIWFDEKTKHFEDREFNWKYLCCCDSFTRVERNLYFYRVNELSVTRRKVEWHTDSIEAVNRIIVFLKEHNCLFYINIQNILLPRVMWGLAKGYAVSKQKDSFMRLVSEYNLKFYMKKSLKSKDKYVVISSLVFLISPNLFFNLLSIL